MGEQQGGDDEADTILYVPINRDTRGLSLQKLAP